MSTESVMLSNWLNGSATGGPNGDGRYPLIYKDGNTYLVYCPAAQALNPLLSEQPIELFAESASASASVANSSASAAQTAAIQAQGYAANAASSASNATSSKNAAATSASTAQTHANDAINSASGATTARDKAFAWAETSVDVAVEPGQFSAKHWAQEAANSAASVSMGNYYTKTEIQSGYAAKATTLGGYGITDAATAGHVHSAYLTKTGDTMTGNLTLTSGATVKIIDANGAQANLELGAGYGNNSDHNGYIANRWGDGFIELFAAAGAHRLRVGPGGLQYNDQNVWHAGNFNPATKQNYRVELDTVAAFPPGNDWNNAITNGWWMGYALTNAPEPVEWFIGQVLVHNYDWITQTVWRFSNNHRIVYQRQKSAGTWGAWERLYYHQATLDTEYLHNTRSINGAWNSGDGTNAANARNETGFDYGTHIGQWGPLLAFGGSFGGGGYVGAMSLDYGSGRLRYRARNGDNGNWSAIRTAWDDANFNPDTKANVAGQVFTGVVEAPNFTTRSTSSNGWMTTFAGHAAAPGFIGYFTPDGARRGYIGWAVGTDLQLQAENGWGWHLTPRLGIGMSSSTSPEEVLSVAGGMRSFGSQACVSYSDRSTGNRWTAYATGGIALWYSDAVGTNVMSLTTGGDLAVNNSIRLGSGPRLTHEDGTLRIEGQWRTYSRNQILSANGSSWDTQPRIFVDPSDPGAKANDNDLWIW